MTTNCIIIVAIITHQHRSFGPSTSKLTLIRNTSVPLFTVELNQGSFMFHLTATLGKLSVP